MATIYCSLNAAGLNDGSSWFDAFTDLNTAIDYALANPADVDNLHVDGNYYTLTSKTFNTTLNIVGGFNPFNLKNNPTYTSINSDQLTITNTLVINNVEITSPGNAFYVDASTSNLSIYDSTIYGSIESIDGIVTVVDTNIIDDTFGISVTNAFLNTDGSIIDSLECIIIDNSTVNIVNSNLIGGDCIDDQSATSNINIDGSLLKGTNCIDSTSPMYITNTTIDGPVVISETVTITDSIILGDITNTGTVSSINTAYYPEPTNINTDESIVLTKRPTFKDEDNYDYTPMFGVGLTLEAFELTEDNEDFQINEEAQVLQTFGINITDYSYVVNDIATFTDYKKETRFANALGTLSYDTLDYTVSYNQKHTLNNVVTKSAFPYIGSGVVDTWPWEWDYVNYDDGTTDNKSYIVPRSLVDITDVIMNEFALSLNVQSVNDLIITAVKEENTTGIAYDYYNSNKINKQYWLLDDNQVLTKKDLYNNFEIDKYNLMSKQRPDEKFFIQVSGLVPYGKTTTGYKYSLESDPNTIINGVDEHYNFEWMPTDKLEDFNLQGLLVYKDNVFVTGKYTISNESVVLVYPAKGMDEDYTTNTPYVLNLNNSGMFPSDITVLEDGSFLIADKNSYELYKYMPQYDYAMISSSNENSTKFLLREQYEDISLEQ